MRHDPLSDSTVALFRLSSWLGIRESALARTDLRNISGWLSVKIANHFDVPVTQLLYMSVNQPVAWHGEQLTSAEPPQVRHFTEPWPQHPQHIPVRPEPEHALHLWVSG
jgi:hypothetical protein